MSDKFMGALGSLLIVAIAIIAVVAYILMPPI